jgi:hypothetical protein
MVTTKDKERIKERLEAKIDRLEATMRICESTLHKSPMGCPHCRRDRELITLITDAIKVIE